MNLTDIPGYTSSRLSLYLMSEQAITGFQFDKETAATLSEHIAQEMQKIADEVEPQLPPRPLKKSEQADYTMPAKPFKKDGTLSAVMLKWMDKHQLELIGLDHVQWQGELVKIVGGKELPATAKMTLANQDDLKDYLIQEGWVPTLFNFKKDERGKPVRDDRGNLIETSPKMQENGRLCPNLEEMSGPLVKQVVKWLSLRNRKSVLDGWLANPRLEVDGRLGAAASGLTNTHRLKHTTVVNVPKAEDGVLLGKEMRSLFVARPGNVLVGYDASALEARVEAHYTRPYPGGEEYITDLIHGDIHMRTTERVFFDKVAHLIGTPDFHKDHSEVKPWRSRSKSLKYASSYGASAPKIAKTLGVSKAEGEEIYNAFWEASKPLKLLKEKLEQFWEVTGDKQWIQGIDGRRIYTRSKHSLVNALFQSCGAIIMETAGLYMNRWLGGIRQSIDGAPAYLYKGSWVYRVGFFHDEYLFDNPPDIADEIGQLGVKSIIKAGEYLKLRVPLDAEYKVGKSWRETH